MRRLVIVVLVIIVVLLALSVTSFMLIGIRDVVGERTAIRNLQRITEAQTKYLTARGEYGTFPQLVRDGFLEEGFADDLVAKRYVFSIKVMPKSAGEPTFYSVNADPRGKDSYIFIPTWRHFYADSEIRGIRVNKRQPATANDPPLEK
jgi:type II secretory pathway pseudopilin PulG